MSRLASRLQTLALAIANVPWRRAPSPERTPEKILVAHYLLLGDTLLLAPLLAKIALRYPEAEKFVLARPGVASLFSGNPYGFRVIPYAPKAIGALRRIRAHGPFDLAFVLGDNRYGWLARAARARWIVAFENDRPVWKNWMVDEFCRHPQQPAAWADMAAAMLPGPPPPPYRPGDWPTPDARLTPPSGDYALLHVGASTRLKTWPAERWRALADRLSSDRGLQPVWSAGQGESSILDAIGLRNDELRFCGSLDLPQLWHLLKGARLLVCPDTGIAHLGKLVGTPTVALFGPGSPPIYSKGAFWRDALYCALAEEPFPCRNQKRLFRREIDWVRRCGRSPEACAAASGYKQYPLPPPCMQAIRLDAVYNACRSLLDHSSFCSDRIP